MPNYFNPESINPGTGWKPTGALGGRAWMQDRMRHKQAMDLQSIIQQMEIQKQQNELDTFEADDPVRRAARDEKIATSNAVAGTIGATKEADLNEKLLKNRKSANENYEAEQTQTARVATVLAQEAAKQREAGLQKLQTGHFLASTLATAAGSGPAAVASVRAQMQKLGMNLDEDPVAQWILGGKDIKEVQARAKMMTDAYNQASPKFREEMEKQRLANQGHLDVEGLRGQNRIAEIKAGATQKESSALEEMRRARTPEEAIWKAAAVLANPEIDPKVKAEAEAVKESAKRIIQAKPVPAAPWVPPGAQPPQGRADPTQPRPPLSQPGSLPPGVKRVN